MQIAEREYLYLTLQNGSEFYRADLDSVMVYFYKDNALTGAKKGNRDSDFDSGNGRWSSLDCISVTFKNTGADFFAYCGYQIVLTKGTDIIGVRMELLENIPSGQSKTVDVYLNSREANADGCYINILYADREF